MQKKLILLLITLLSLNGFNQKIQILNLTTNEPIENVKIKSPDNDIVKYSDKNGYVTINEFKLKELIYFFHPSFEEEKRTVTQLIEQNYTLRMIDVILLAGIEIKPPRESTHEGYSSVRISKINSQQIKFSQPQTSADMLQKNSNILIQKSQAGGGSPIIRGFEANKVLLVIDGVRLNNAIYRGGHLQNAITVDNNILSNTDIFYGPGSVIYGSDALGGVVHFHTKNILLSSDTTPIIKTNFMSRIGSANGEITNHIDFNYGEKKWGSLTSITYSKFNDFKMGKNRSHGYQDYGLIPNYVTEIDEIDSMVSNPDKNKHPKTGYNQLDVLQKLKYTINKDYNLGLNFQYSTSSKINRFDKLNEYKNNTLKYAEWYYGPQNRLLTSLRFESKKEIKIADYYTIIGAFQKIDEDRISRKFRETSLFSENEDVYVFSVNADFLKKITKDGILYYGAEVSHNKVKSTAFEKNIETDEQVTAQTRYPNGENRISSFAIYGTMDKKITEKWTLNLGGRYNYFINYSSLNDTFLLQFPFNEIKFNTGAFSGSFSLKYQEKNGFRGELIGSSGFRSPNVDDYGKVFEKNGNLVVPNDHLKPEYVYNGELNFSKTWVKSEREYLTLKIAGFYTFITDAIVKSDYFLNNQDSVIYRGEKVKLQSNQNINSAVIYGSSFDARVNFTSYLKLNGSINFTKGKNLTDDTTLSHIPPVFGRIGLTYTSKKFIVQLSSMFNGMKKIKDYGPGTTDNPVEATVDGAPKWAVINFSATYKINQTLLVQGSVENILDTHYKQFASGISGLGRNFTLSLRANF